MAAFPDIYPEHPLREEINFKTITTRFEDLGVETRKQKWLYPKRNFNLQFRALPAADAKTLWEFYIARKGTYEAFSYFLPWSNSYSGEYIATGDGTTTAFNVPGKTISAYTFYQGATTLTETTDYTISATGGSDGEAQLNLVVAATAGERITCDFTGYLKVRSRFKDDHYSFDTFYNTIVNSGLGLVGLLNNA